MEQRDDIAAGLELIQRLLGPARWQAGTEHARAVLGRRRNAGAAGRGVLLEPLHRDTFPADDHVLAWYGWLAEQFLVNSEDYDRFAGARTIPVVLLLGRWGQQLADVDNGRWKLRRLARAKGADVDGVLWELLVAAMYLRNQMDVAFVRTGTDRAPDLLVSDGGRSYGAECKKKDPLSAYSRAERAEWVRLWTPVKQFLGEKRWSIVLTCNFYNELSTYDTDYIIRKVRLYDPSLGEAVILDDDTATMGVTWTRMSEATEHFRSFSVRMDSAFFLDLLFDHTPSEYGITVIGEFQPREQGSIYLDDVRWASAGRWVCVAEESLHRKLTPVYRQLQDAADQLDGKTSGVVHFGIEQNDGETMMLLRKHALRETVLRTQFDPCPECLYLHVLGFSVTPSEDWAVDEQCHFFATEDWAIPPSVNVIGYPESKQI